MLTTETTELQLKVAKLLQMALIRIRAVSELMRVGAYEDPVQAAEIADLADLLHNAPLFVVGAENAIFATEEELRELLVRHLRKFQNVANPKDRYLQIMQPGDGSESSPLAAATPVA